jgi:hypothetical protein
MGNDRQELPDKVQVGEQAISFLNQHPYGLLFADDETAEYEFIWAKSPEELFKKAYEMVEDARLAHLEDYGVTKLDKKSRDALERARTHFEMYGLTETTLSHLMSIDPYGDRAGIPWWGSFDQLKTSDHGWAMQMRSSFRRGGDETPIRADEAADFATYVTREPFIL